MALTEQQDRYLVEVTEAFQAFKQALSQAFSADNNRETHLDTADERRRNLQLKSRLFVGMIGVAYDAPPPYALVFLEASANGNIGPSEYVTRPAASSSPTLRDLPGFGG